MLRQPLAFIDLETTGATAALDRVTEIGIVELDADGAVREWQQLVNPGVPIPPFIEQLTGIGNAMVADAPPFAGVAEEVRRRLESRLFIAHNARFDYGFLKHEFKRLGTPFKAPVLCTVKLSRALYPEYQRHSLDALIDRHRLHADARHRALADARLIHQFWQKIQVDRSTQEIADALAAQVPAPILPPQLNPALADELPDTPGIFAFHDGAGRVLWIGKAGDISRQVFALFASRPKSARDAEVRDLVRRISWQEAPGEIGARLLEARLRRASPPTHQRPRRPADIGPPPRWPFAGPAVLRESTALHLVDRWRYLGTADSAAGLPALLAGEAPLFDPDIYAILSKHAGQLIPL